MHALPRTPMNRSSEMVSAVKGLIVCYQTSGIVKGRAPGLLKSDRVEVAAWKTGSKVVAKIRKIHAKRYVN